MVGEKLISAYLNFLNRLGLKKLSEFLRSCLVEALKHSNRKTGNNLFDLINGMALYFKDPKINSIIKRNTKIALAYSKGKTFEKFLSITTMSQTKIMAKLIAQNWTSSTALKILDIGSHYGYLIDDLKQYPNLNIDRYIGVDLSLDVVSKAKQRVKNKFNDESRKYDFIFDNALNGDLYKTLPNDNDIIVFSGLGHLNSEEMKLCLNNFNSVLSKEKISRICLTSTVFEAHSSNTSFSRNKLSMYFKWLDEFTGTKVPNIYSFIETASQHELDLLGRDILKFSFDSMIQIKEGIEENVLYRLYESKTSEFDYEYHIKDRCQFEKFLKSCDFEIEKDKSFINSALIGLSVDYLCLKRK